MSKTFVIADTHFGDTNILKYEKRPFKTKEEMDLELIARWNEKVSKQDRVFHLGDVGCYPKEKMGDLLGQLNGKKILILGNHDTYLSAQEWRTCGFEEVYTYPIVYDEFIVMQHQPPQYINDAMPFYYLYGHVHGTKMYPTITPQSACVCVERWDYAPVNLETIKNYVDTLNMDIC